MWVPFCLFNVVRCDSRKSIVRLIGYDGKVKTYSKSIKVVDVIKHFPEYHVCHADAFCIGQKVPALREEEKLKLGHSYFLLPIYFFQSVLSFVTVVSFLAKANGDALTKVFDICKTPQGFLQVRINEDLVDKVIEKEMNDGEKSKSTQSLVCTTESLEKDYRQLVRCKSEMWKPKLETIKEKGKRLEAFESFKRKKKDEGLLILHPLLHKNGGKAKGRRR